MKQQGLVNVCEQIQWWHTKSIFMIKCIFWFNKGDLKILFLKKSLYRTKKNHGLSQAEFSSIKTSHFFLRKSTEKIGETIQFTILQKKITFLYKIFHAAI